MGGMNNGLGLGKSFGLTVKELYLLLNCNIFRYTIGEAVRQNG